MSPTARSLKYLRSLGWTVAIVEKTVPHSFIKQDFFGFADLIAVNDGIFTFAIQVTSSGNISARVKKIIAEPRARIWLQSPWRKILVHGWKKRGGRGERKLWRMNEVEVTL